jgi:orotate phosphoribosyltransferase
MRHCALFTMLPMQSSAPMLPDLERALFDRSVRPAIATRGHFRYESGHHGDLWLDLDALLVDARAVQGWAAALAQQMAACRPEVVCGPLTGGAFVAQALAAALGAAFVFAERRPVEGSLDYRIPDGLRARLAGRHVVLADDAINAGSALLATLDDIRRCGAELAGFASLIMLGDAAATLAASHRVPFVHLVALERSLWPAQACPLCAQGVPLDRVA